MNDYWMDIKSFDEDGFTIEVHTSDGSVYVPNPDTQFAYIVFEKMTWWEYVKHIIRKIFKREDR